MAQVWKLRGPPDASMRVRVQLRAEGKDWFMQKESLFIILPSSSSSSAAEEEETQTLSPLGLLLRLCINIPDELQMNVDSQKYDSNQRPYCFRDERESFNHIYRIINEYIMIAGSATHPRHCCAFSLQPAALETERRISPSFLLDDLIE